MAEIVNLRRFRKARARSEEAAAAARNRATFGRSAAESALVEEARTRADAHLAGHRRERPDADDRA